MIYGQGTSPVSLETLGGVRLLGERGLVHLPSRKSRALLAYLALAPYMTETRVRLAGLLWSENTDEESRVSLRQQIMRAKADTRVADQEFVKSDRLNVWLEPSHITVDVVGILEALDRADVPDILVERKGLLQDFLKDLDNLDPAFDYWRVIQREALGERILRRLGELLARTTDPQKLYRAARATHNLDPTNEEACRAMMRHHARHNDIPAALRAYNDLWRLLEDDYDTEPSKETQELVAHIKLGQGSVDTFRASGSVDPGGGELLPHILILVQPFSSEGVDQASMARVVGLRHELIAALTRFRDWSVRDASPELAELPEGHRKVYEIVANVAQEAQEVAITLMLRRHADQSYLWSQRFSIGLESWFRTKLALIKRIAASLEVQLSVERLTRTAGLPDQSLDVYDRWLRGNGYLYRWKPDEETKAENIFRSIIADRPSFAPAYAGLASILNTKHHVFPGRMRDQQREQEALDLAKTAAMLDPLDSRTQLCLAWSHILNRRFEQAVFYYDLALQTNENDPWTLTSSALGLAYCGEKDRARAIAAHALNVAAGAERIHWCYQMCIRYLDQDYAGSLAAAEHAEGTTFFVDAWKAAALVRSGRHAEAHTAIGDFFDLVARHWFGEVSADPQTVYEWFSQCFPIRHEADRELLNDGVVRAGLLEMAAARY